MKLLIGDYLYPQPRTKETMEELSIVVVEDEPIVAEDLRRQLKKFGYDVVGIFYNAEEALPFIREHAPDLLLMDVNLGQGMDGIEAVTEIRKTLDLPVIYLTGNTDEFTYSRARRTDPAAFLSKPFRSRDLQAAIELAAKNFSRTRAATTEPEPTETAPENTTAYLLRDRFFVKKKDHLVRLFIDDIHWVEAQGGYLSIGNEDETYYLYLSIGQLEELLSEDPRFMRIHRSSLINLEHVDRMSDQHVYLGKKRLAVSRSNWAQVMQRIQRI